MLASYKVIAAEVFIEQEIFALNKLSELGKPWTNQSNVLYCLKLIFPISSVTTIRSMNA